MVKYQNYSKAINRTSAISYFVMTILFASIKILLCFDFVRNVFGELGAEILSAIMQIGVLFCLSICIMKLFLKQKSVEIFRFYGFKKINFKGILISIAIGIVVYILNVFISSFFNTFLTGIGYNFPQSEPISSYPVWLLFVNILLTAVLPAICEETAHRGMLLNGMSANMPRKWAIVISSIMFGLLHCRINQFFYATIIGLLLGYIVSVTENIYPAIIIHFMNNALSVFMGFSQHHKLGADYLFTYVNTFISNNVILGIVFVIALMVALGFLLHYLVNLLLKKTIVKQLKGLNERVVNEMQKLDYEEDLQSIVKTGELYHPTEIQDFARFKTLFMMYSEEYGFTSKIKQVVGEQPNVKDRVATAFYATSFAILSLLTIFSFVWGVI